MSFKLFWVLLGARAGDTSLGEPFQYDYCSWLHSQHVIDRIKSEVEPIFETYGI